MSRDISFNTKTGKRRLKTDLRDISAGEVEHFRGCSRLKALGIQSTTYNKYPVSRLMQKNKNTRNKVFFF